MHRQGNRIFIAGKSKKKEREREGETVVKKNASNLSRNRTRKQQTVKRSRTGNESCVLNYSCIFVINVNEAGGRKSAMFENHRHPKQWWELRWLQDSVEHQLRTVGQGGGRERRRGLSRMETSRSKTIRESSGITCANYFAKQSLAVVFVAAGSRSTVTILVWSGCYNVAAQCLPVQVSLVSDVATR